LSIEYRFGYRATTGRLTYHRRSIAATATATVIATATTTSNDKVFDN
jgi:hypothetical protein